MREITLKVDENGTVDLTPLRQSSDGKSVIISRDEISIETGSLVGDVTISIILGVVVVGSLFAYGYFFGTRKTEEKIQAAIKADRLATVSRQINVDNA